MLYILANERAFKLHILIKTCIWKYTSALLHSKSKACLSLLFGMSDYLNVRLSGKKESRNWEISRSLIVFDKHQSI